MIQIDQTIVSSEVLDTQFVCDLSKCNGMCCVYGDSGAPLEDHEIAELERIYPKIKPYMTKAGIRAVERHGFYVTDIAEEKVTPIIKKEECVYAYFEGKSVYCAIEKAFRNKEIDFYKPISCHLYPIRITKYKDFEAVNYHRWDICRDALCLGKSQKTPLYVFLKEPLIRKYGAEWYEKLCIAADHIKSSHIQTI